MLKTKAQQIIENWRIYEAPFGSYVTKYDPSLPSMGKNFSAGQNMTISSTGSLVVRDGTQLVGATGSAGSTPITSEWNFVRRDGTEILLRSWGTRVEYYHTGTATWELLQTVTTSDLRFGRAVININSNATSFIYFCNGGTGAADVMYKWNAPIARIQSTTATTITVQGTTTIANLGFFPTTFSAAQRRIIINGTIYTYSAISGDGLTFTVTTSPTGEAVGSGITQVPIDANSLESAPSGNILLADKTRLFVAGISGAQSEVRYSNLGISATDPNTLTWTVVSLFSRVAGDPGRLESPDGNGPIVALAKDNQFIYLVQPYQATALKFTDPVDNRTSGATTVFAGDFPVMRTIKPFDGKSQSTGGRSMQSASAGANGLLLITQDNQILFLTQPEQLNVPQLVNIGDVIQPTLDQMLFNRSASIFYKNRFFIAARSSSSTNRNDTMLVYDITTRQWDLPYLLSASDFAVNNNELNFGSDNDNTSFKFITSAKTDNTLGQTASFTTAAENFGVRHKPKVVDKVWIDGFTNQVVGTTEPTITIEFLYDRDGVTSIKTLNFRGNEANGSVLGVPPGDAFGLSPFGISPYGSPSAVAGLRRFFIEWELKDNLEVFECALRFTSTLAGADWQVLSYGYHLSEVLPVNKRYLKA